MLQIVAFIMAEIWKGASGLSASSYSKADSFAVNGDKSLRSPHSVRAA